MLLLLFATALSLSAIAAFYSIMGLVAIFSAAVVPIVVMGSILEVSKLVVASWLYRNWKGVPTLLKTYFTISLVILMTLTSMGIFGFLSKAHLDQSVSTGDVSAQLSLLDEKIKQEKETINEARKTLTQLDQQVDQTLSRTANQTDDVGVRRSVNIRKNQARERSSLYSTIQASQEKIAKLNQERAPVASQARKVEAEVGPIKYIAALIYGDNLDQSLLEKAVRIVILMIVAVFDPLAVLMLVAANWTLQNARKPKDWHQEWVPDSEAWPLYEPDFPEVKEEPVKKSKPKKRKWLQKEPKPVETAGDGWNENRMDTIAQNGNDGIHYDPNAYESPSKTIEQEVEELNSKGKKIEYDSAGRRMTP